MNISFIFHILILITTIPVSAAIIEGKNEEYAGKELLFFKYSDIVTKERMIAFSLKIDNEGNFKKDIPVNNTTFFFSDFGIYRGLLFLEPEKTINLLLPPLREKSFAQEKNPYFEPVEFWFATKNGNHLNDKVSAFDSKLNQLTDKYFNQLYFRQSRSAFDSLITDPGLHLNDASETLQIHKQLRLKSIEIDVFRNNPSVASELFSTINPLYWENPAFIELFEKCFNNRLGHEIKSTQNNDLKKAVLAANVIFIRDFIYKNYHLTGQIAKLALLKMLYDGFYSGDFPQNIILSMISSDVLTDNRNIKIQDIAQNILKKLKYLRSGTLGPVICLKNTNGHRICTNKNNDKYKYLVFADIEMIIVREHLKYLTKIEEQFNRYLEIFIILKKTDLIEMKIFLNEHKIPGTHLIDENDIYIEEYRVRTFPSCFLLDANHKLELQHVKAPLNGFEQQFGAILEKHLLEK